MLRIIDTVVLFFCHMCKKGSFRYKLFTWCLEQEIYNKIFPHRQHVKDCGYSFKTAKGMKFQTDGFNTQGSLDLIEEYIRNMPHAYGESFRYILHRDLHKRLSMYEQIAMRRVQRSCDPRFVATRA